MQNGRHTDSDANPADSISDGHNVGRPVSRRQYLDSLLPPTSTQIKTIDDIQLRKESEIDAKYKPDLEQSAATTIQKAYRGHRERRQMQGLILDPSTRWSELIRELRFRAAVAQSHEHEIHERPRSSSSILAKAHWDRIASIAEYASAGDHGNAALAADEMTESPIKHRRRRSKKVNESQSMLMDLRYFLEMVDEKHRYGANLQIYHEEWQRSDSKQNFFQWLDHGDGRHISHPYCDRAKLASERIRYLSKEERRAYLVAVDDHGLLRWEKNGEFISTDADEYRDSITGIVHRDSLEPAFDDDAVRSNLSESRKLNRRLAAIRDSALDKLAGIAPRSLIDTSPNHSWSSSDSSDSSEVDPDDAILHQAVTSDRTPRKRMHVSPATILNSLLRKTVRPGTWIYVADTVGRLYVGIKSSGSFQHASFLSGARISSAGSISIKNGRLTYLSPLSGHYRPTTKSFRRFVDHLKAQHVDLSKLRVSQAYQVLLGMEYYGAARSGLRRLTIGKGGEAESRDARSKRRKSKDVDGSNDGQHDGDQIGDREFGDEEWTDSATDLVEKHWEDEHRRGLRKLMDDLNIR